MIVTLTGTLTEALPTVCVIDAGGVGFELGISNTTAASLPEVGTENVKLYVRMVVRESTVELYGFSTREERTMFDKLVNVSGVGPKLALSVLSTFTVSALIGVVSAGDKKGMSRVPGVGAKTASRLIMELADVLAKNPELRALATADAGTQPAKLEFGTNAHKEAEEALLSMGFTPQEAELALDGADDGADTSALLSYALRRLGGRN